MKFHSGHRTDVISSDKQTKYKRRNYSIFELPSNFFNSCGFIELLSSPELTTSTATATDNTGEESEAPEEKYVGSSERWTCNTCKCSFDSLYDQRLHFKSDFHLFNIKLSIAGRDTIKDVDFDNWTPNSLVEDYGIASISGLEDEDDTENGCLSDLTRGFLGSTKQKFIVHLPNGETLTFWKCLLLGDSEKIVFERDLSWSTNDDTPCTAVKKVIEKLLKLIHEPRNNTHLRVMMLARGGYFAGCVFDGNSVVAHKTFHRYLVRSKAGKKQSSEDGSGKLAHSAGASIRRQNELALKKDIRELLVAWKPYFDDSACIFIHAPSHNRQLLFDGEIPYFSCQTNIIRHIPLTVRRPTFKEAQRLYNILTQISTEPDEEAVPTINEDLTSTLGEENTRINLENRDISDDSFVKDMDGIHIPLPLHEAAKAGNVNKVMELLEQGLDPCVIDERGRTPYRLAAGKEIRNTFRRFMAMNPDKWDWQAAKVPSPLTKEMEESQNSKKAKKEAKRKARAKELKLLRKAKEKKAQDGSRRSHQGTQRISSRVAGVLVLVIGSLMVVAFRQMGRGRTIKHRR